MFRVHRSNRMEELVLALAGVVARPLASAFEQEVVLVQSKGMQRWVALELARRHGIFANARFPFPRTFIDEVLDAVLGTDPATLSRERAAWALSALMPELVSREELAPIRRYLADDPRGEKRRELCERIAYVFDQYAVYRPDWVLEWDAGVGSDWQAITWRALMTHVSDTHVAERVKRFERAWSSELPAGLPSRVSIIGVSSLPPVYLRILSRLAEHAEVHLFHLDPSQEFWGEVRSPRELSRARARQKGRDAELHLGTDNALLGSLGKTGRDFQQVLESTVQYVDETDARFVPPGTDTALHVLQSDILTLRERGTGTTRALPLDPGDASVALVSCHSPMREVEVLRDRLLGLLNDDETLQPSDIVVMAVDIDEYAPYIEAVFGSDPKVPGFLPHRIADRSERVQSPVAEAVLSLLRLSGGRFTASEVLDILELEPVRARFGISPEEQSELAGRVHEVGVRWGMDAAHRESFGQPAREENTWRFGLSRLLVGYALPLGERATFEGVLPFDDVEGDRAASTGRLARFVETLFALAQALARPRPLAEWKTALYDALAELSSDDDAYSYPLKVVREKIAELAEEAESVGFFEPITREVVLAVLSERLASERSSHDFLAGGITFCALLPMRSVPFRVVCLLGLGDEAFPRVGRPPSFDKMAREPRVGDRSLREDDRHLFLEALLSARDHLYVSWVGRAIQDDSERPPSVVVGELLDVMDRSFYVASARPQLELFASAAVEKTSAQLVLQQPLAPFSERYFDGSDPRLFSFAGAEADAASIRSRERRRREPLFEAPLAAAEPQPVSVDDLARFFELPVRHLLENRLKLRLRRPVLALQDREPMDVSALEQFGIGSFMLDRLLEGSDPAAVLELLSARGILPLGAVGQHWFEALLAETRTLVREIVRERGDGPSAPWHVELPGVVGSVGELFQGGQVRHTYSRLSAKRVLALWVRHLVLAASGFSGTSSLVSRCDKSGVAVTRLAPLPRADAEQHLKHLLDLYDLGDRGPLPLFPAASETYVQSLESHSHEVALGRARKKFKGSDYIGGSEATDAYVARVFGDTDPLADGYRPLAGFPTFVEASQQVFAPLLRHRTHEVTR